ncbi:WD repeat-containing and planar cell polarity effector protein fritz homolog [Haliotis asinina]|uniref:WD repeat-containing and planar cell polarity effector protein fritz homolog n=1 Tax=Haliotis asinina TaxID=109174 RepID=UPI003531C568
MVTCLSELFLWSLKNHYSIPDGAIGCHVYHDKGEQVNLLEQPYYDEKQQFTEARDMVWSPRNKRPEKIRDNLKEVEELLSQFKCVQVRWKNRRVLQLVLSNCCVLTFVLTGHSGDVEKIIIDKSMVAKFNSDTISDVYLTDQFLVACHYDCCKMDYAHFTKRPPLTEAAKRIDKLSTWEPKSIQLDLPGPKGRRLERRFSSNIHNDLLLVWWYKSSDEAWPWTPMSGDRERANLMVMSVNGPNPDVLTYTKTECDPVHAAFSAIQPHKIYTVEQALSSKGDTVAQACIYEVVRGKIQRVSVTNIPLKASVLCQCRNPSEDKLLMGCSDASLVMYDEHRKLTQFTRAAVLPLVMSWHPGGTVVFVGSARGDVQLYDMALNPLRISLVSEDPGSEKYLRINRFFRGPVTLTHMDWCPFSPQTTDCVTDYMDALFLTFDKGPPAVLLLHLGVVSRERLSPLELVREYLKHKQIDEAVGVLSSLNWDTDGHTCYSCLSTIVNNLLRMPLNADREAQLEATLGTFYAPKPAISEVTILEYRDPISRLARRFFHYLLRYARFDKAFLLAVDIGSRDLFMDIHHMALDKGETALAEVAKRKAEQVDSESLDSFDGLDEELSLDDGYHNGDHNPHQDQENLLDQLPRSRQHPWQSEYYRQQASSSSRSHRFIDTHRHRNGSVRGYQPPDEEYEIDGDLIHDYTAALMDQPPRRQDQGHRARNDHEEEEEEGNVKVIHFGVV